MNYKIFQTILVLLGNAYLMGNPQEAVIQEGTFSFSNEGEATLVITQESHEGVIAWESFSIDADEMTQFVQPAEDALVVNKVLGGNISNIYGTLKGNGNLYLFNEEGVFIGPGGKVQVDGTFIGSTLDNLKGEEHPFTSEKEGSIRNEGVIESLHGDVILLSKSIENRCEIKAVNGEALLLGSSEIYLKEKGEKRVHIKPQDGGQVINSGTIKALSTEIEAGGSAYGLAINQEGMIEALGFTHEGGKILLRAHEGKNHVGGTLVAQKAEMGGEIFILGEDICLDEESHIQTTGDKWGGEIFVGGGFQGKDPNIPNGKQLTVAKSATLDASCLKNGDGGKIILWGDFENYFFGTAKAMGGEEGGNGGLIEVSSPLGLVYRGDSSTIAPNGKQGELLLDPYNVIIGDFGGQGTSNPQVPGTITSPYTYQPASQTAHLDAVDLAHALEQNNVTVTTAVAGGTEEGNITINKGLQWNNNTTLTLNANRAIIMNSGVTFANTHHGTGDGWNAFVFQSVLFDSHLGPTYDPDLSGIEINGAIISSLEGDIVLKGRGGSAGIKLMGNSHILSNGTADFSANITLIGKGDTGETNTFGVNIPDDELCTIKSMHSSADISITGSGSATGKDVFIGDNCSIGDENLTHGLIDLRGEVFEIKSDIHTKGTIQISSNNHNLAVGNETSISDRVSETMVGHLAGEHLIFGNESNTHTLFVHFSDGFQLDKNATFMGVLDIGGQISVNAADLTIESDHISFDSSAVDPFQGSEGNTLTIKTVAEDNDIVLGASSVHHLGIPATQLVNISSSNFSDIVIGGENHNGQTLFQTDLTLDHRWTVYGKEINIAGLIDANNNPIIFYLGRKSEGTFTLNHSISNAKTLTLNGGDHNNTFINGIDINKRWNLLGNNAGNVEVGDPHVLCDFSHIGSLKGGQGDDTFRFMPAVVFSGSIDGVGGYNVLDYSKNPVDPHIDQEAGTANNIQGGFSNINEVIPYTPPSPPHSPSFFPSNQEKVIRYIRASTSTYLINNEEEKFRREFSTQKSIQNQKK